MHSKRALAVLAVALLATSPLPANDTGVLEHFLNLNATLPALGEALSSEDAASRVGTFLERYAKDRIEVPAGMRDYWRDFDALVGRIRGPLTARPVVVDDGHGTPLVARHLVGFRRNGTVAGFFAVDAKDGAILSRIMWTPEGEPLWTVSEAAWDAATSVNVIPELDELVPPVGQFTTGIPIDPRDPAYTVVDGFVDELPLKTQEERSAHVTWFNETHGTDLNVTLKAHRGRRTASSKCMSVAASYLADWWSVRSGRSLGTYRNPAGGQQEYGFNPRLLETLFYKNGEKAKLLGKYLGTWKVAPMSKDRVTGEPVPYSPRGYARILVETGAGTWPDPLVPKLLTYETKDNAFAMDERPHVFQIFTSGLFPRRSIADDLKRQGDADFPFTLAQGYGEPVTVDHIARALATWGPMLGQHMGRNDDGSPKDGRFGMGVHAVCIVGTGVHEGTPMLVYRETFGDNACGYLEDSFLGPSFRLMPIEYFFQAMAFPHRLGVTLKDLKYEEDASLVGTVEIRTNGGRDLVDADLLQVTADGKPADGARFKNLGTGTYRLWLPMSDTYKVTRIEVRAAKRYFADHEGRNAFGVAAHRPDGRRWEVVSGSLEPTTMNLTAEE